jgi:hypothetical protein
MKPVQKIIGEGVNCQSWSKFKLSLRRAICTCDVQHAQVIVHMHLKKHPRVHRLHAIAQEVGLIFPTDNAACCSRSRSLLEQCTGESLGGE